MSTPVTTVDDYTLSLIQHDVVRFFPGLIKTEAAAEVEEPEEEVAETKVVRPRGRRPAKAGGSAATK